jgi:type I restriction enzyme S subunit
MEKLQPQLRFPEFGANWETKPLIEVSNKITDGTHDTPKPIKEGIPFLTAIHLKDGFVDYNNCYYLDQEVHNSIYKRCNPEKGDLLMVNIGAGTATCAINSVDYEFSLKNVALVKPNKKIIDGLFLAQVQRKKSNKIFNQLTSGGAQPFLSLKEIGRLKITFPSLPEQTKIATFLTAVDEKLTALKQKKTLLEQYKKGVMQKIFSQELRFKDYTSTSLSTGSGNDFADWEEKKLGDCLEYLQPTKYLVSSTEYNNSYKTPVLTAGKTFILGYTNESNGIFETNLPVIIFDDFTTATQFVDFPFKAKSSAMKILRVKVGANIKFMYETMRIMKYELGGHERHWISKFAPMDILIPSLPEQTKIANFLAAIDKKINHCQGQIEKAAIWKKGLLQQMFV